MGFKPQADGPNHQKCAHRVTLLCALLRALSPEQALFITFSLSSHILLFTYLLVVQTPVLSSEINITTTSLL